MFSGENHVFEVHDVLSFGNHNVEHCFNNIEITILTVNSNIEMCFVF